MQELEKRAEERSRRFEWFAPMKEDYVSGKISFQTLRLAYAKWCQDNNYEAICVEALRQSLKRELRPSSDRRKKAISPLTSEYLIVIGLNEVMPFSDIDTLKDYIANNTNIAKKVFKAIDVKVSVEVKIG